ncbi:hypothetical protein [Devosia enhydra]|nr:hypothetical protein [Devosia enhydra]
MQISHAKMETPISTWRSTLIAARTDDGEALGLQASSAFLAMRSSGPQELDEVPPDDLDTQSEMLFWDFLGRCDLRHLAMLREAEAEAAVRVATEQARGEMVLAEADAYIATLRRQRRSPDATEEKRSRLGELVAMFEEKQSAAAAWLVRRLAGIREGVITLEADVVMALANHGEVEELQTVRWTARHRFDRVYSQERSDSFFLGPNPPRRRNRIAEARLAWDRQYDDESSKDRRARLDMLREERRREWTERIEQRRREEAEQEAKREAARAEFAQWSKEQQQHVRHARRAARFAEIETAREQKREARRQLKAKGRARSLTPEEGHDLSASAKMMQRAARRASLQSDEPIDNAACNLLGQGAVKAKTDIDEYHDWMKGVGLV